MRGSIHAFRGILWRRPQQSKFCHNFFNIFHAVLLCSIMLHHDYVKLCSIHNCSSIMFHSKLKAIGEADSTSPSFRTLSAQNPFWNGPKDSLCLFMSTIDAYKPKTYLYPSEHFRLISIWYHKHVHTSKFAVYPFINAIIGGSCCQIPFSPEWQICQAGFDMIPHWNIFWFFCFFWCSTPMSKMIGLPISTPSRDCPSDRLQLNKRYVWGMPWVAWNSFE